MEMKYSINFTKEDIVGVYIREWVMKWVKRYHPEAFDEARKFVEQHLKDEKANN